METRRYRELHVWRESVTFVPEVYACLAALPPSERWTLAEPLRRAVVRVPARIASGQARSDRRGFLADLRAARAHLAEADALLTVAEQLGYLSPEMLERLQGALESVSRPLEGLIARVREDLAEERSRRRRRARRRDPA